MLTYVTGDDWCGLYDGDRLIMEGHSISTYNLLKWMADQGHIDGYECKEADLGWLDDRGDLPGALSDVKFA